MLITFFLAFAAQIYLMEKYNPGDQLWYLRLSVLLRLLLLFSFPGFSDDIYRFLWDGYLVTQGNSPYVSIPSDLGKDFAPALYEGLNSKDYFSVYPPVAQFLFAFSTLISAGDPYLGAIILRIFILLSEVGTLYIALHLSLKLGFSRKAVFWYGLNPLVILEGVGNLHLEVLVVFFLALSILMLSYGKVWQTGVSLGLAFCTKLLPLIFLPFLWRRLSWQGRAWLYGAFAVTTIVFMLPFLTYGGFNEVARSLDLYFRKFEFNASIYYLVRETGYWIKGYNIIATAGPWLAIATAVFLFGLFLCDFRKKLRLRDLWMHSITLFLLFSTTVHPWYVIPLVFLGSISGWKYPVYWSMAIFLTYMGYSPSGYSEQTYIIIIEYIVLLTALIFEIRNHLKSKTLSVHEI